MENLNAKRGARHASRKKPTGAATLLDRLTNVKPTGHSRWIARCPAHPDKSPSLSIRELDDGAVLIYCFAGCGALDVLTAAGLDWSALYPDRGGREREPLHSSIPARDLLVLISEETSVVAIILADALARETRTVTKADWARLTQAAARIARARDHAYGR